MKLFLKKYKKKIIIISHDCVMVCIAWSLAFWFRYNLDYIPGPALSQAKKTIPLILIIQLISLIGFGCYRGLWRFASISDLMRLTKAGLVGTILSICSVFFLTRMQDIPRSIFPLYTIFLIFLLGAPRLLYRLFREHRQSKGSGKPVLIIGAGRAGESIIRDLKRDELNEYKPVAIVDDDPRKQGIEIHGVRVVGEITSIPDVITSYNIEAIFIAIPSATSTEMRRLLSYCEKTMLPIRTLPSLSDLTSGNISIRALREVSLEDLLGRDQAELDWSYLQENIVKKSILVTGAGGSIGSELCRQLAALNPVSLILLDHSEYNLYAIERELSLQYPNLNLQVCLNSVTDKQALMIIVEKLKPDYIFHAAAYKHVPLLESQTRTAIQNNVLGTYNIAKAAIANHVEKFVLISTDKAVHPTNVMGATKRAAENICQAFNAISETQFITVRFGNVLGSAGSVIPLFKQQLANGGPLTVTHPEITRYFMTIPEASQLIMQASSMGNGGEVFVLDMGEPIKIRYLAEQLITLSGKEVDRDIEIIYTGLRPGEKLFEELFYEQEEMLPTNHEKIMLAQQSIMSLSFINDKIELLESACLDLNLNMLNILGDIVPEFVQIKKVSGKASYRNNTIDFKGKIHP